jgi:hypothetical protein
LSLAKKLVVAVFLFLLAAFAVTVADSRLRGSQLSESEEKLCMTCHSPNFPPNDTSHIHTGFYEIMTLGSPCWECHGQLNPDDTPTHDSKNAPHPTREETALMHKDILECSSCHYAHNIHEELQTGRITSSPPPSEPTRVQWMLAIAGGVILITGAFMFVVSFAVRKSRSS